MIGILSDNILLEIFDRYRKRDDQYNQSPFRVWKWQSLVHVCRRWRQIILASPRRLDLQLLCTYWTPFRKIIDIWPTIPFVILYGRFIGPNDEENIIAALEHPDRVSRINLSVSGSQSGMFTALMQEPFPFLTHLSITSEFGSVSVLPDGFLGGSAQPLQQLTLRNVLYPALPMLLSSASNLVNLSLLNIPRTGYISPEAMVSHLATSPKLEIICIEFDELAQQLATFPNRTVSPPMPRVALPTLHKFSFFGARKYLEDFVSRIDAPQLNSLVIYYYWRWDINLDAPQLSSFINRSEGLKKSLSRRCKVTVDEEEDFLTFCVGQATSNEAEQWNPEPGISICLSEVLDGQNSHLTSTLGCIFPILSDVVHCTIDYVPRYMSESEFSSERSEQEDRDDLDWLQLLQQLPSLQTLFVPDNLAGVISQVLAYVDNSMVTELLPALQLLRLKGWEDDDDELPTPSVRKFLAARQDSGYPVTFVETREKFEEKLGSYT